MNTKTDNKGYSTAGMLVAILIVIAIAALLIFIILYKEKLNKISEKANGSIENEADFEEAEEEQESAESDIASDKEISEETIAEKEPEDTRTDAEKYADEMLSGMDNNQKAAQLFFVALDGLSNVNKTTVAGNIVRQNFEKIPVGGVIIFANNISNKEQLKKLNQGLQTISSDTAGLPLFIGVDEEGGKVARLADNSALGIKNVGTMQSIGATNDVSKAYQAGQTIGSYLNEYGFNLDFAPDADVLSNPNNKVIGTRSFGNDPGNVSAMAENFSKGLRENGIIPCYKHFPGHGATNEDSHNGMAVTNKTEEEMKADELIPFIDGANQGIESIMVSHISCPAITGDNTPASISSKIVTDMLKNEIGYKGLVITDALNMGAITNYYSTANASVKAFEAGNDMLLMTGDLQESYQAVLSAIERGEISEERLNESVRKILILKYNLNH